MENNFINWSDLSREEKIKAIQSVPGRFSRERLSHAKDRLKATVRLLEGNQSEISRCWRILLGNFIVNEPEQVAEYCKILAEKGE